MKYNGHKSQLGYLSLNPRRVQREQIKAAQLSVRRSHRVEVDNVRNEPSAHAHWLVKKILCCRITKWMSKKKKKKSQHKEPLNDEITTGNSTLHLCPLPPHSKNLYVSSVQTTAAHARTVGENRSAFCPLNAFLVYVSVWLYGTPHNQTWASRLPIL